VKITETAAYAEEQTQSRARIAKMTEKEKQNLRKVLRRLGYTDEEIETILKSTEEVNWI
jgi:SOS response regulatory protein OraA/RecX